MFDVRFPSNVKPINVDNSVVNSFETYTKSFLLPSDIDSQTGIFNLKPWHVKNVTIPDFNFKKDGLVKYGPFAKSIPVMDFDGFELKIDLEEDSSGTVKRLIQWCQARNIHKTGTHWPPELSKLPYIEINIISEKPKSDTEDNIIGKFRFEEIHFLNASEASFSYSESSAINYSLTFNSNYYTYEWY